MMRSAGLLPHALGLALTAVLGPCRCHFSPEARPSPCFLGFTVQPVEAGALASRATLRQRPQVSATLGPQVMGLKTSDSFSTVGSRDSTLNQVSGCSEKSRDVWTYRAVFSNGSPRARCTFIEGTLSRGLWECPTLAGDLQVLNPDPCP